MTMGHGRRFCVVALLVGVVSSLSSCFSMNMGIGSKPDTTLSTSSVANQYVAQPDSVSDQATIRNAVSSVDMTRGMDNVPWANTSTGSAGVISQIREENVGSYVCRTFVTTRHSYTGVSKYTGKACLVGAGAWQLVSFREQS